jgi:hypothetical protein
MRGDVPRRQRVAAIVLAGAATWAIALLVSVPLRPDLDPLTAHPEAYAAGPWDLVIRIGYTGLASAAAGLAFLVRAQRLPALLFGLFAVGAVLIGLLPPTGEDSLGDRLFPYAQLAPLAFFPAALWVSWREHRLDLRAMGVLALLLFLPLAIGEPPFGGMLNRSADMAMAAWLGLAAIRLGPRAHP